MEGEDSFISTLADIAQKAQKKPGTQDDGTAIKSALRRALHSGSRRVSFDEMPPGYQGDHEAHARQRRGNEVAVKKVVDSLYNRVLDDSLLRPFFDQGTDMAHLVMMQQQLMSYVFGGEELLLLDSPQYDLRAAHLHSLVVGKLSTQHWEAFVCHFQATLDEQPEIPSETKSSALKWMRSTKDAFRPPTPEEVAAFNARTAVPGKCPFH